MSDKIYCGSGKIVTTQYGDLTKISFHKEDLNKMVKYIQENGGDWVNLVLKEKKEPQEGKPTHYLEIDTWKPSNQNSEPVAEELPPLADQPDLNSQHLKDINTPRIAVEKNDGLPF